MVFLDTKEADSTILAEKLDQCCVVNETKKKKKSKKKTSSSSSSSLSSSPSATSPAPFYQQSFDIYPVKLNQTKSKGRHAVADQNIEEGTTLFQEKAVAFVVRSEFLDQQCHVCLSELKQKMMCSDCRKTVYCSKECSEQDNDLHMLVCGSFAQVDAIGRATDVDVDMLRLITLLMARKYLDTKKAETKDEGIGVGPTPYWCVEDLLSHRESVDPSFINVIHDASQRLLMEMPETIRIPVDDMITLACRINSNSHGLGDNHSRNTDVALGLFPLSALFNHSCNPNATFVGLLNGRLEVRTIRPVSKDEELVVSYIDLYSDRDERRQELLMSKHFWCKCKRCIGSMDKSVDRFLQGVVCTECENDVYVIPATSIEQLMKGNQTLYAEKGCFKCAGCGHEASSESVRKPLEQANNAYMSGMIAIRQERNYRRGAEKLELVVNAPSKGGDLHSLNAYRLNSYIPMMNCKRFSGDLKGSIEVNKAILESMEQYAVRGSLPANTSEISDYWQNLGELCIKMASEAGARSAVLEKKWLKEASSAFTKALKMRTIVFGEDHSKTKYIRQELASCNK